MTGRLKNSSIWLIIFGGIVGLACVVAIFLVLQERPEELNGVWNTVSSEYRGAPDKLYLGTEFRFRANEIEITNAFQQYTMSYTSDSGKKPNQIDVLPDADNNKAARWIYELSGDTLKLCWDGSDAASRPTAFKTDKNSDSVLLVLERINY